LKGISTIILLTVCLLTGCTPTNTISEGKKNIENDNSTIETVDNISVVTPINSKYEFTYLEDLTDDKLQKYNHFLEDGNINHLSDFTPEQIVLIFMNLILNHNDDRLYELVFDNGQLPSLEIFSDEYDKYLSSYFNDEYLKYRFFDSIGVVEETRGMEDVTVKIEMKYGFTTHSVAYGLKKDNNVWKMDLYHLVEKFKKENE
jgi:hypothetical protein